jgi:predicted lipoprotein with Yx(FWY)xxD motif
MKRQINLPMFVLLAVFGFSLTQCSKTTDPMPAVVDPVMVKLANSATLGSYLTDKDGNALYYFSNDADGSNNCTGGCITAWPIFNITGLTAEQLGAGLTLGDFNAISTPNGNQLTYKGWPLYYYAPGGVRESPGQTTGEAVGGVWFVAKPDYTIMLAKAQLVGKDGKNYIVSATNVYTEGVGKTTYFTDLMGRTLYEFAKDSANINKYTKADFSNNATWPIYETDKIVVPSILDKTLFSSIMVFGKKQLTYKGWPMYYYGPDVNATTGKYRGYNMGVSVPVPGVWPVFFKDIPAAPHK